jgi:hypothetical protein
MRKGQTMNISDLQSEQQMQQFRENYQLRTTGVKEFDDNSAMQLAKLKIAMEDGAPEYRELKTEIAMLRKAEEKVLPALKSCLSFHDGEVVRTRNNLMQAQTNVDRLLDPKTEKTDVQQLIDQQQKQEIRAMLAGMAEGARRKVITDALQKDDASLLTAWLSHPVPQSDHGILRDIKAEFDESRAAVTCQRDFEILRAARAICNATEIACNLAKSSMVDWMRGYWGSLSTDVKKQILSKPENAALLQAVSIRVV